MHPSAWGIRCWSSMQSPDERGREDPSFPCRTRREQRRPTIAGMRSFCAELRAIAVRSPGFKLVSEGDNEGGYRDAVLNDQRCFDGRKSVPLDRVRAVRNFQVVIVLKIAQGFGRQGGRNRSSRSLFAAIASSSFCITLGLVERLPPLCWNKQSALSAPRGALQPCRIRRVNRNG
jgi:hypothetical protein